MKYADKGRSAAIQSGKRLKHTEIKIREIAERLRDLQFNVDVDDQPLVQATVDKLEDFRTEILKSMFGSKNNDSEDCCRSHWGLSSLWRLSAQANRRDPLTDAEVDKLRDAAQLPEERIKLYIHVRACSPGEGTASSFRAKAARPRTTDPGCLAGFSGRI